MEKSILYIRQEYETKKYEAIVAAKFILQDSK